MPNKKDDPKYQAFAEEVAEIVGEVLTKREAEAKKKADETDIERKKKEHEEASIFDVPWLR